MKKYNYDEKHIRSCVRDERLIARQKMGDFGRKGSLWRFSSIIGILTFYITKVSVESSLLSAKIRGGRPSFKCCILTIFYNLELHWLENCILYYQLSMPRHQQRLKGYFSTKNVLLWSSSQSHWILCRKPILWRFPRSTLLVECLLGIC